MSQTASPHCERGVGGRTKGVPSGGASRRAAATRGAAPEGRPTLAVVGRRKPHKTARDFEKEGWRGEA